MNFENGERVTGRVKENRSKYYFSKVDYKMFTGERTISGKPYTFAETGELIGQKINSGSFS